MGDPTTPHAVEDYEEALVRRLAALLVAEWHRRVAVQDESARDPATETPAKRDGPVPLAR